MARLIHFVILVIISASTVSSFNGSNCGLSEVDFNTVADCITDIQIYMEQQANITSKPGSVYPRQCNIGCIAYTPEQCLDYRDQLMGLRRRKRKVSTNGYPWPTTIYYSIDSSFTGTNYNNIRTSLNYWQDRTCLTFTMGAPPNPGTSAGYLRFISSNSGCWSYLGNLGYTDGQPVNLNIQEGCPTQTGVIIHEIGHALGLVHEQTRTDRGMYLTVNSANIDPNALSQYAIDMNTNNHNLPYDYSSTMHYTVGTFSTGAATMTPSGPNASYKTRMMGDPYFASYFDIAAVNKKVCQIDNGVCSSATVSCLANGHPDPKDCTTCRCIEGLGGTTCNEANVAGSDSTCPSLAPVTVVSSDGWSCVSHPTSSPSIRACHWYLKATIGCTISVKVDTTNTAFSVYSTNFLYTSSSSASFKFCTNWVEIRTANIGERGLRLCSNDPVTTVFTSASNEAVITYQANRASTETFQVCYKLTGLCDAVNCGSNGYCGNDNGACVCKNGFSGTNCDVDPCTGVSCGVNGKCVAGACVCTNGFTGTNCEIDPCTGVSCGFNGNCVAGTCVCTHGYTGANCETPPFNPTLTCCGFLPYEGYSAVDGTGSEQNDVTNYDDCWKSCLSAADCPSFLWDDSRNACIHYTGVTSLAQANNMQFHVSFCGCSEADI